jgi:hypothetical protein
MALSVAESFGASAPGKAPGGKAAGAFGWSAGDCDEGGAVAGASSSLEQALTRRVSAAPRTCRVFMVEKPFDGMRGAGRKATGVERSIGSREDAARENAMLEGARW